MPQPTPFHRMPWADFDAFARLQGDASMIARLRGAELSRRKLLVHALLEASAKTPGAFGPLPPLEAVWDLLARVENVSPVALDEVFAHPYTGSWAGYSTRLLTNDMDGVCPLWIHLGHVHALAAAAAITADLDFEMRIPVWDGNAVLPSLGTARLPAADRFCTAVVTGGRGRYVVRGESGEVRLPARLGTDSPGWWALRTCRAGDAANRLSLTLDDLDPYRGLHEPLPPDRLSSADTRTWRRLLSESWDLLRGATPELAGMIAAGLDSVVPKPNVPFQNPSASTGEAFGSAVIGLPEDAADLAATLVHEHQHIVLGGVLHLARLYENDRTERIYVPWRDDPRPLSGAYQGVYAFFGVTAFWRSAARSSASRRAAFEFAHWRGQTWRTLLTLRKDATLTDAGRRFLDGIAEVLGPWQQDPVPEDVLELTGLLAADHRAGWLLRHLRPDPAIVSATAGAWLAGRARPPVVLPPADLPPTPVPDGPWSRSRATLLRLGMSHEGREQWRSVPGATEADFALIAGHHADAASGYRAELHADPDRPVSLVGLGLALNAAGPNPAARALLHCPEMVRAVHRELRRTARDVPTPEQLARWLGQLVSG
ncbi:HEXXH motif-containing putative peptide modification protein [Lentzea sp. HUAS12]|uniref:aKG-HExxH-type peptide beta-hydroxylase n=1 Tax=Lentzea sp. HUAS12 TaxID=2951806 RepID=UPI00209E303A|nr:HEXXH motif-containing putative peptide modification protein [Lentzea sp. HUAS12]USX56128.1 HEXXH motif-containing putative peptide modification protein [Lentzea sp. HUAS12]